MRPNNNHFIRNLAIGFISFPLIILMSCGGGQTELQEFSFSGPTMGTTFHVTIVDTLISAADRVRLPAAVDSILSAVNQSMSTYQQQSEISQFNNLQTTDGFEISEDFATVVHAGIELCDASGGAFDATVAPFINFYGFGMEPGEDRFPTVEEIDAWLELTGCDKLILEEGMLYKASPGVTIDLSAIAKGYGSDIACNYLVDAGFENVFVEVGGEIMVNGKNIHSEGWRIGVDRPQLASTPGESLQHILAVSDYGVATSGDYRNYREVEGRRITHTIDPRTGYPIEHSLASATVISTTCMDADGYATAAMVMGLTEGLVWLEELENVEGLLITRSDDGGFSEHMTTGFAAYIVE